VASFAVTVQWLWQWLGDRATRLTADPRRQRTVRHAIYLLLAVGLALLVLARFQMSWPRTNQRDRPADTALQPGQAILADDPAHGAAVLGLLDENLSLRYLTEIWGRRPDVTGVSSDQARALLDSASRPLYVTTAAAPLVGQEVSPQAHLSSAGADLIAVSQGPATQLPAVAQVIDLLAGDGLALAGYQILPADATPEAAQLHVRLFWQALRPIEHDWSVSVRPTLGGQLVRQPDGTIVQADLAAPVHGTYPTGRWQPGEVVADDYLLPVPARQPADGLQVVVYRPLPEGGFDNLAVLELPLN
jgi:hypothetical protein